LAGNKEDLNLMVLGQIKGFNMDAWEFAEEEYIGDSSAAKIDASYVKNLMATYNQNPFNAEVDLSSTANIDFDGHLEKVTSTIEQIWQRFVFESIESFIKCIDLACLDQALNAEETLFKTEAEYRMAKKNHVESEKAEECYKRLATLIDTICAAEPAEEGVEEPVEEPEPV